MSIRCFWCDSDTFNPVMEDGNVLEIWKKDGQAVLPGPEKLPEADFAAKDAECVWCGHLASEPNPRAGNPEETLESVKDERDEVRAQLEQCMAEKAVSGTEA